MDVLGPRSLLFVLSHTARRRTGQLGFLLELLSGVRLPAASLDARPRGDLVSSITGVVSSLGSL